MGTTLTGTTPQDTYDSLIKVTDNGPLSGTAKYLSDGLGNDSTLALSTGNVGIGTTSLAARLHVFGNVGDMLRLDRDNTGAVGNQIAFRHSNAGTLTETATINVVSTANADTGSLVLSTKPTGGSVAERMRINAAGKVGINTTSALGQLNIRNESAGATTNALALYNNPSNTENTGVAIEFYPNVGVDDRCARISAVNPTTSGQNVADLRFFTSNNAAPTEKLRILASGGITFNGDTAAANALDDYEEGTWTPTVTFGNLSVGLTYTVQSGKYVKVGSKVSLTCYVVLSNKGTSVGAVRVTGLPFTIPSSNGNYGAISFFSDGNISYTGMMQGFGNINSTTIVLAQVSEAGTISSLTDANFANDSAFMISFTYFVS